MRFPLLRLESLKPDLDKFRKSKSTQVEIKFLILICSWYKQQQALCRVGHRKISNLYLKKHRKLGLDFGLHPKSKGIKIVISFVAVDTRMRAGAKPQYLR